MKALNKSFKRGVVTPQSPQNEGPTPISGTESDPKEGLSPKEGLAPRVTDRVTTNKIKRQKTIRGRLAEIERRIVGADNAKNKFSVLDSNSINELDGMLVEGRPYTHIVKWLQDVKGLFTDQSPAGLANAVSRYHERDFLTKYSTIDIYLKKETGRLVLSALAGPIDIGIEYQELIELQKERIAIAHRKERMNRKPDPDLRQELALLKNLLDSFSSFQFSLGVLKKTPDKLHLTSESTEGYAKLHKDTAVNAAVKAAISDALTYLGAEEIQGEVSVDQSGGSNE